MRPNALLALLPLALPWPGCSSPSAPASDEVRWLVVDQDADPLGLGGHPGAIFEIDPRRKSLRLFCATALWSDPADILAEPDGTFLVVDYANPTRAGEVRAGQLLRVSADGRNVSAIPLPPGLRDPYSLARAPDGSVWITDKNADPRGQQASGGAPTGTVWRWRAQNPGKLEIVATGAPLRAPAEVRFRSGKALLLDADAYRAPGGGIVPEGAIFELGAAGPEVVMRPAGLISPLSMLAQEDGSFLILDTNGIPRGKRFLGALLRADPARASTSRVCAGGLLCDPVRLVRDGASLLVVDASADPLGCGDDGSGRGFGGFGPGAILRVDPASGRCSVAFAAPQFVTPTALLIVRTAPGSER